MNEEIFVRKVVPQASTYFDLGYYKSWLESFPGNQSGVYNEVLLIHNQIVGDGGELFRKLYDLKESTELYTLSLLVLEFSEYCHITLNNYEKKVVIPNRMYAGINTLDNAMKLFDKHPYLISKLSIETVSEGDHPSDPEMFFMSKEKFDKNLKFKGDKQTIDDQDTIALIFSALKNYKAIINEQLVKREQVVNRQMINQVKKYSKMDMKRQCVQLFEKFIIDTEAKESVSEKSRLTAIGFIFDLCGLIEGPSLHEEEVSDQEWNIAAYKKYYNHALKTRS